MADGQAREQQGSEPSGPVTYDVNFFKPQSAHSRADMRMITIFIVIWAVAVFGFQVLLMVTNTPTPESAYTEFQEVWGGIADGSADAAAQKTFSRSLLSVLGKNIAVKDVHKAVLKTSLCWSVSQLLPADQKPILAEYGRDYDAYIEKIEKQETVEAEALKKGIDAQTETIVAMSAAAIGLADTGFDKLRVDLLPTSIVTEAPAALSDETKAALPDIMTLYLIHNRSALTDTPFLGFPFHYWYTAQFLLILFVVLCLIYAIVIDKINTKYNFTEK